MTRLLVVTLLLVLGFSHVADAQINDPARRQRREFVGDLLKTLIESQVQGQRQDLHNGPRHAVPGRPVVPARRPRGPVVGTREMQVFRTHLNTFQKRCDALVVDLQVLQTPQARVLLADAMQLEAQCQGLIRQASYIEDHKQLIPAYQRFDQQWRVAAHRIRQTPGINASCMGHVDQLYDTGTQLCECLGVGPSVNRAKLAQLMANMKLSFQHLCRDLQYDNQNNPKVATVINQGQELYSRIGQGAQLVQREPYDVLVTAYKQTSKDWRRYARKLRPYSSERVRQGIQEIEELGRAIHEELWLPVELDFEDILAITRGIEGDSGRLFASITLQDIMACTNPGSVINNAREFQRLCGTFAVSLEQGLESWEWEYQLFNVQWQTLRRQIEPIQEARVRRRIREIDDAMSGLNQMLGQGPAITHHDLIGIYENLDLRFSELDLNVRRNIINHPNYDRALRQDIGKRAKRLRDSAHGCHQALLRGQSQSDLTNQFTAILNDWTTLKRLSTSCNEQHRGEFAVLRREIEPAMVKLQVVFTN